MRTALQKCTQPLRAVFSMHAEFAPHDQTPELVYLAKSSLVQTN
ncbi:Uncharacterised protein [Vibrio cholerae]|nr:Uncharacterised protein [Vibrio cholerae]